MVKKKNDTTMTTKEKIKIKLGHEVLGKSIRKLEKETGRCNVSVIKAYQEDNPEFNAMYITQKDKLLARLNVINDSILGNVTPAKIQACSLPALATSFGILFDKCQIIQGQPDHIYKFTGGDSDLSVIIDQVEEGEIIK